MSEIADEFKIVESGLGHLCEFIEDCEFTYLSTQILHVLGTEGPKANDPAKYIRYIYNRIILENATVRAAAVSSLAQFGAECEALRPRVTTLIRRALHDNDDEVRDRATLYMRQLQGGAGGVGKVRPHMRLPLKNLENCLKSYAANPSSTAFDLAVRPAAALPKLILLCIGCTHQSRPPVFPSDVCVLARNPVFDGLLI
eukprot:scaffold32534_cov33-Prasinocladus_malaysianus.AAC.2